MRSEICLYDLERGVAEPVLRSDQLVEAPNWTRDGAALIVNSAGRLFRVPLATPALHEIDTDFANGCNNDHGISPDGSRLVISDRSATGESCLYTLPIDGGTPRRVTDQAPSYWHGWSPDGAMLAYVGRRGRGPYEVFSIPTEGGDETRLAEGFEHCDGPDYSADGNRIWFNGQRDGRMQLWRMCTDGTGLEQMTNDTRCNWFPHPSPDGRHVVYLSYAPGTDGHPRDREVELRLIPAAGSASRLLLALFGGQGTINVPSWSPDSRHFAFVRYARP